MKSLSVLLVDDNPTFLGIACRFLAARFPTELALVGTARSGAEALDLAPRLRPDAVVVDLGLPDLSGIEVVARLRSSLADVALVVLTVHDDEAHRQAALESGADAFVGKADLSDRLVPALMDAARSHEARPEQR